MAEPADTTGAVPMAPPRGPLAPGVESAARRIHATLIDAHVDLPDECPRGCNGPIEVDG